MGAAGGHRVPLSHVPSPQQVRVLQGDRTPNGLHEIQRWEEKKRKKD